MIYFIRAGDNGPVKIGWSNRVPGRVTALQPLLPFKVVVARLLDAPQWVERWLHWHYRETAFRVNGSNTMNPC